MTNHVPQPCARWADLLAAHPNDLSTKERRALDTHVASCPACAAVRVDYERMATQIRGLPDPRTRPGFPPWLLALQEAARRDASAQSQIIPFHSTEKHMHTKKDSGQVIPAPAPINQGQRSRRRVASWIAAVAALVVLALITAALLASHTNRPSTTGTPKDTATPSPVTSKGWSSPAGLAHLSASPYIAPSNPQVIYLSGSNPVALKRSDDGGAHWKYLPLPPKATLAALPGVMINADNAQNVFLVLSFDLSSSACSGIQASSGPINGYSGASCTFPYYSTDGGEHWALMRCQGCGQAIAQYGGYAPVGNILVQGNHLYSTYYAQNGSMQLITSTDSGANWTPADAALVAQGQGVCGFAADPKESTIFALAQSGYCTQAVGYGSQPVGALLSAGTHPQAGQALSIWRSDDAGAHWTPVSAFPYQQPDTASFKAIDTGRVQPTLYGAAGEGSTYQRLLSTDGGKTWHPLPTAGIPASAASFSLTQAPLSDGSLLMEVQTTFGGPTTFYALKPGSQVWHQIAPQLNANPTELVVSAAGGHDTLWVTTVPSGDFSAGDYSIFDFTLQ